MFDQDIQDNPDLASDAAKTFAQTERDAKKQAEQATATLRTEFDTFRTEQADKLTAAEQKVLDAETALTEAVTKAETDLSAAGFETERWKVAHAKGIPAPLVASLTGTTKAELETKAEELKPFLNTNPQPDPTQGGAGSDKNQSSTTARGRELMAEGIDI